MRESAGNLGDAADALRRLAEIDRRNRIEHLTGIAKIESRLGGTDAALKAGRDLLAAAPGNPDSYEFFAQLCFQLGRPEEGLDALRRAVRGNPHDTQIVLSLADTLANQYQTEEAIEMYWRAFDRADDLDRKLDVVRRLTELYLQRNQFDRLLTRLEHQEREGRPAVADAGSGAERDTAMCLAQALTTSGDLGGARAELERLLASNTRDTQLLKQLSKLAEEEGDIESAARYQKQLVELVPSDDETARLADLYARGGNVDDAQAVWSKLASGKSGSLRAYKAIDSLLVESQARARGRDHRIDDPPGPERLGGTLSLGSRAGRDSESPTRRPGGSAPSWPSRSTTTRRAPTPRPAPATRAPSPACALAASNVRDGCEPARATNRHDLPHPLCLRARLQGQPGYNWSPDDFGSARMAALGWLLSLSQRQTEHENAKT